MDRIRRLTRLVRAEGDRRNMLEMRVAALEQTLSARKQTRSELQASLENAGSSGLILSSAGLRRLADVDREMEACRIMIASLQLQLRTARIREDALAERAGDLHRMLERRRMEGEAREVAMAMDQASRKGRLLE